MKVQKIFETSREMARYHENWIVHISYIIIYLAWSKESLECSLKVTWMFPECCLNVFCYLWTLYEHLAVHVSVCQKYFMFLWTLPLVGYSLPPPCAFICPAHVRFSVPPTWCVSLTHLCPFLHPHPLCVRPYPFPHYVFPPHLPFVCFSVPPACFIDPLYVLLLLALNIECCKQFKHTWLVPLESVRESHKMGRAQAMNGVCMGHARKVHGACTGLYGPCTGRAQVVHGVCTGH